MKHVVVIAGVIPLMLLLSCSDVATEDDGISNLSFYDGFESDSLRWFTQTARSTDIHTDASIPPRGGNKVLHFEVFKSDPWVENGPRSEILRPAGIGFWREGDEVWIGGSIFFPEDTIDDPMQEIVWQVHDTETGLPFLIQSVGADIVVKGKGIHEHTVRKKKGEWMDIVTHHRWSSSTVGITQVFIDGALLLDASGITNMTAGKDMYPKFGIYKSGWKFEGDTLSNTTYRELWYDEIRIGNSNSSFEVVSPQK